MTASLDPVATDPSLDTAVALLLTTDLTIDELLSLRLVDVYSGVLLVLSSHGAGRRVVKLRPEARHVLDRVRPQVYDPDSPLFVDEFGGLPTHDQVLRSVADHLEVFHDLPKTPSIRAAIKRLGRVFRQGLLAA